MREIPQKYKPAEREAHWEQQWNDWEIHKWNSSSTRDETFVVDTPPPTVSGSLHIGHVFSYTHQDLIVRYQRMKGKNIHYGMGWDDNGLPTERRVQNVFGIRCDPKLPYVDGWQPNPKKGKKDPVEEISRQNFIEACEKLTVEDEKVYEHLWRRMGLSIDWDETYATIDEHSREISQLSFLDLVKKGQVYQAESPTMWDVDFKTAVAQAEVEDRERPGAMHDIRFGIKDGGPGKGKDGADVPTEFMIATTRPELLAACIAVVAHPDDERYQPLFGMKAITPLFGAEVPILPAEHADPEKGTGILMVCTFGDAMDVEWWKSSKEPLKQVIGLNGRMLPVSFGEAPFHSQDAQRAHDFYEQIVGLTAKQAKAKTKELLEQDGTGASGAGAALVGEPKELMHPVKFYEKGDRPLEFVPTRQWFVKILEHKDALIEQGKKIEWHPSFMGTRYERWVEGLAHDWCISRQRYFGVPFPVWYPMTAEGEIDYGSPIYAAEDTLPIDPMADPAPGYSEDQRGQAGGFVGDPDVMDTWATSSLTPQIQSQWGLDDARHQKLFPMDIRPQSHEIIRTWAFYTIVKAWMHENEIPWSHVVISGWILDPDRKKMSKSKGNVQTPEGMLDDHSVDAVRYWAGRARLGTDTTFDETVFKVGKKLATKIFNASRFVFTQIDRVVEGGDVPGAGAVSDPLDQSFLASLGTTIDQASSSFEKFEYAGALQAAEDSFWDFCDNYLELVKTRSYAEEDTPGRRSAIATLNIGISAFLRMLAPFVPYVTEEVWSWRLAAETGAGRSVHTSAWPSRDELPDLSSANESVFSAAAEVLGKIRGAKSEAKKSLKWPVAALEIRATIEDLEALEVALPDVLRAGVADGAEISRNSEAEAEEKYAVRVTLGEEVEG